MSSARPHSISPGQNPWFSSQTLGPDCLSVNPDCVPTMTPGPVTKLFCASVSSLLNGNDASLVVGRIKEFIYISITVPGPCCGFAVIIIVVVVGYVPVFPVVPASPKLHESLLSSFVFTVAHPSQT